MAIYRWEGRDDAGHKVSGKINARNKRGVKQILRQRGIRVKRVIPPSILELDLGEWMVDHGLAKPFTDKELISFTRQLQTMISAGLPIIQSLEIIGESEKRLTLRRAVQSVMTDVSEGQTIAEAMKKQPGFGNLYCNLVKVGEASGTLDVVLSKLVENLERRENLKSKIRGALVYPTIVIVVGIGVVIFMMMVVVPTMQSMLADQNQELPQITEIVIFLSKFIQENFMILGGGLFLSFASIVATSKTKDGKRGLERFIMKVPILGSVVIRGNLASFCKTLSVMIAAGIPLVDALEIAQETIDHAVMARDFGVVRKKVMEGKTLTEPFGRIAYFPNMVVQLVRVGEQTGAIDSMLDKVSMILEEEVNNLVSSLTKLIEPFIIIFLAIVIGGIVAAMYLPIIMSAGG